MVHPTLKRKRDTETSDNFSMGLRVPSTPSYIAPDAVFISCLPTVHEISGPTMPSSPPTPRIEHPSYISHLPPPPKHDPFPAIRLLFDSMTPKSFANLLRKRVQRLLSEWPPTLPSQSVDGLPSPTLSSSSNHNRRTASSISVSALHAFVAFFRTDEFQRTELPVSMEELYTDLVALQTLLSIISCQELWELIHSRLRISSKANQRRWTGIHGLLEILRYTRVEDEAELPLRKLAPKYVEIGINTIQEVDSEPERLHKRPKLVSSVSHLGPLPKCCA